MVKILLMTAKDLASFVRETRNTKGFSLSKVSAQSGGKIAGAYVNQIENEQILPETISVGKLIALAKGLQVSQEDLNAIVFGKPLDKSSYLWKRLEAIGQTLETWREKDQKLFLRIVEAILSSLSKVSDEGFITIVPQDVPVLYESAGENDRKSLTAKTKK